jgi:hypothetical protein
MALASNSARCLMERLWAATWASAANAKLSLASSIPGYCFIYDHVPLHWARGAKQIPFGMTK